MYQVRESAGALKHYEKAHAAKENSLHTICWNVPHLRISPLFHLVILWYFYVCQLLLNMLGLKDVKN